MNTRTITTFLSAIILAAVFVGCEAVQKRPSSSLRPAEFNELPLGAISADGWLKETLLRQKEGATGHLDELYPQVMGPRNGWLGGDGDQAALKELLSDILGKGHRRVY